MFAFSFQKQSLHYPLNFLIYNYLNTNINIVIIVVYIRKFAYTCITCNNLVAQQIVSWYLSHEHSTYPTILSGAIPGLMSGIHKLYQPLTNVKSISSKTGFLLQVFKNIFSFFHNLFYKVPLASGFNKCLLMCSFAPHFHFLLFFTYSGLLHKRQKNEIYYRYTQKKGRAYFTWLIMTM